MLRGWIGLILKLFLNRKVLLFLLGNFLFLSLFFILLAFPHSLTVVKSDGYFPNCWKYHQVALCFMDWVRCNEIQKLKPEFFYLLVPVPKLRRISREQYFKRMLFNLVISLWGNGVNAFFSMTFWKSDFKEHIWWL